MPTALEGTLPRGPEDVRSGGWRSLWKALGPGEQGGLEGACVHAGTSVCVCLGSRVSIRLRHSFFFFFQAPFSTCNPRRASFQVILRVSPPAPLALGSGGSPQ